MPYLSEPQFPPPQGSQELTASHAGARHWSGQVDGREAVNSVSKLQVQTRLQGTKQAIQILKSAVPASVERFRSLISPAEDDLMKPGTCQESMQSRRKGTQPVQCSPNSVKRLWISNALEVLEGTMLNEY